MRLLMIRSILLTFFLSLYAVFSSCTSNYCVDVGYTPGNGSRTPPADAGFVYFKGAVIRYSCDKNFMLRPDVTTQTCTLNSEKKYTSWIPTNPPTCVEGACPRPVIKHGTVVNQVYHYGEHIIPSSVHCETGFEYIQGEIAVCMTDGNWSTLPVCTEKPCPEPPNPENGHHNMVQYRWIRNYFKSWIGSLKPLKLANSSVTYWPPGTVALYSCNDNYDLVPSESKERICARGAWSGDDPTCVLNSCLPPANILYGNYTPVKMLYDYGDVVTYWCMKSPPLTGSQYRTCLKDNSWSGEIPSCFEALTTVPMPVTTGNNVYCKTPTAVPHGDILGCYEPNNSVHTATLDPEYCCGVGNSIQFICDYGYSIVGEASQWLCVSDGGWEFLNYQAYGRPTKSPTCRNNSTRPETSLSNEDFLKPVIGTVAGVLTILIAVIIVAFCRPKLKDIKRRWRELREDEDELIIDGRRILLPSYEEAVSSRDQYADIHCHPSTSSLPNISQRRNSSVSSRENCLNEKENLRGENVSYILQLQEGLGTNRPSTSSDEDMLVPAPVPGTPCQSHHGANGTIPKAKTQVTDSSLPLELRAGTSGNFSILINEGSNEREIEFTDDVTKLKLTGRESGNSHGEILVSGNDCSMANHTPCSGSNFQFRNEYNSDTLKNDPCERHYADFIFPLDQNPPSPVRIQPDPELSRDVHDLLTYPLKKISSAEDAEPEQNSIEIDCSRMKDEISKSTRDVMSANDIQFEIIDDRLKNSDETCNFHQGSHQEEQSQLPDNVCLITSSQVNIHERVNQTNSTTV